MKPRANVHEPKVVKQDRLDSMRKQDMVQNFKSLTGPDDDGPIRSPACNRRVLRHYGQNIDWIGMLIERVECISRCGVPDLDGPIVTTGYEMLRPRVLHESIDLLSMPNKLEAGNEVEFSVQSND